MTSRPLPSRRLQCRTGAVVMWGWARLITAIIRSRFIIVYIATDCAGVGGLEEDRVNVLGVLDGQEPGDRERLPVQNNKHKLVLGLTLPKRCDSRQAFHNILSYLLHKSPLCSPGPVVTCELPPTHHPSMRVPPAATTCRISNACVCISFAVCGTSLVLPDLVAKVESVICQPVGHLVVFAPHPLDFKVLKPLC